MRSILSVCIYFIEHIPRALHQTGIAALWTFMGLVALPFILFMNSWIFLRRAAKVRCPDCHYGSHNKDWRVCDCHREYHDYFFILWFWKECRDIIDHL